MGAANEGIAGGLITAIWQPDHEAFSASHWRPGTSVADDSGRLWPQPELLGLPRLTVNLQKAALPCWGHIASEDLSKACIVARQLHLHCPRVLAA